MGLVFLRNNSLIMENMDKGLTVPKQVLIVWLKIPPILSALFVCPSPKVLDFNDDRLHWASVVCGVKGDNLFGRSFLNLDFIYGVCFILRWRNPIINECLSRIFSDD